VQGGYGDDESETGPAGSDSVGRVLVEELAATGVTAELTPFDGGSDFDAFVEAGIPTGGVYTGDEGVKTSEQADRWGGQAGAVFDPCYHAACDRAEGIHRGALDDISDAIAGTLARFAASTDALGLGFANILSRTVAHRLWWPHTQLQLKLQFVCGRGSWCVASRRDMGERLGSSPARDY
jgi:Zn-dependent M28 family amino/carboxypeptidase